MKIAVCTLLSIRLPSFIEVQPVLPIRQVVDFFLPRHFDRAPLLTDRVSEPSLFRVGGGKGVADTCGIVKRHRSQGEFDGAGAIPEKLRGQGKIKGTQYLFREVYSLK